MLPQAAFHCLLINALSCPISLFSQVWLRDALPQLNPTAQKVAATQQLTEALANSKSLREFSAILDRYNLACRRNV